MLQNILFRDILKTFWYYLQILMGTILLDLIFLTIHYFKTVTSYHIPKVREFYVDRRLQLTQFHLHCCTSASFIISCVRHPLSTAVPPLPPLTDSTPTQPLRQYPRQQFACVIIVSNRLTINCRLQAVTLVYNLSVLVNSET